MPRESCMLIDVSQDVYTSELEITPNDVGGPANGYRVAKRTLHGGLRSGVDVVEVDNGLFRFTIIPSRGMGIWKAGLDGLKIGWNSPVRGPVHPGLVPLFAPDGLGWLSGFDELLVRCGLQSNGSPEFNENGTLRWPLHGQIANTPAEKVWVNVDGGSGEIRVAGETTESRIFGAKLRLTTEYTIRPDQPGFHMVDTVTNLSAAPAEMQLLYHINFGMPLVAPGTTLHIPFVQVSPRNGSAAAFLDRREVYLPEQVDAPEQCFFYEPAAAPDGWTLAVLRNESLGKGLSLKFNKNQLPYFTQWKNHQPDSDGYVTGLEPGVNFPNTRSFEKAHGRVPVLEPGASRTFEIEMLVHDSLSAVDAAVREVESLQADASPQIHAEPKADWCE